MSDKKEQPYTEKGFQKPMDNLSRENINASEHLVLSEEERKAKRKKRILIIVFAIILPVIVVFGIIPLIIILTCNPSCDCSPACGNCCSGCSSGCSCGNSITAGNDFQISAVATNPFTRAILLFKWGIYYYFDFITRIFGQ